jgi:hypothetical protein
LSRLVLLAAVLSFATVLPVQAQRLEEIRAAVGSRVRIELQSPDTRLIGKLASVHDSTLAIELPSGGRAVDLGEVRHLDLSLGPDRLGYGALGFAVGVAIGVAAGYTIGKREEKRHPGEFAGWKPINGMVEGGLIGVVLGTTVGVIAAREDWYRLR